MTKDADNRSAAPPISGGAIPEASNIARAPSRPATDRVYERSAHDLHAAAGLIALSVLLDSAVEHYRGSYHNKAMFTPLVTATITLTATAHGLRAPAGLGHAGRRGIFVLAVATGAVGTGFHVYDILAKPGGISWQNLFYAAPLGAPSALIVSGLAGFLAEHIRATPPDESARVFGHSVSRSAALGSALALVGTSAEAALLHFRGAFQNPAMFFPVTLPPVAAGLLGFAGLRPAVGAYPVTQACLTATAAIGLAGTGFHAYGVARAMGGWRNWHQNLLDGPPIPTPPSFAALALAGRAALRLLAHDASRAGHTPARAVPP